MYLYPVITIYSNIVYVKLDIKSQLFRSELVNHVVFLKVYNILIKMLCFIVMHVHVFLHIQLFFLSQNYMYVSDLCQS